MLQSNETLALHGAVESDKARLKREEDGYRSDMTKLDKDLRYVENRYQNAYYFVYSFIHFFI